MNATLDVLLCTARYLDAKICGIEVGAKICGAELGAKICGAEVPGT